MVTVGYRRWICGAAALLLVHSTARPEDGLAPNAAEQLRQHGLVKITGRVWGLPLEQQLRERLKGLAELRERIVTAEKELAERMNRNEAAWKAATTAMAVIDQELGQLPEGDLRRRVLREQRAKIRVSAVPPADLPGHDSVRGSLSRLAQDRCTLALDLFWIRSTVAALGERYRELAGDDGLQQLVRDSGEKCRLGPARNYQVELRRLDEYDKLALAPHVPVYLQGGRTRVAAVVADAACVTFTYSEATDAVTYLSASAAHAAGIAVPADAREESLRIGGRTIVAREVFLPSLRLGSIQAKAVAAFVLPPEAEDLGSQLTPQALSPHRAQVERERLRLALENSE